MVKLHTFHDLTVGFRGLGLLDGDDAIGSDLLHCVSDQTSDGIITGRNRTNSGNVAGTANSLGLILDFGNSGIHSLCHALFHDHGIGSSGQIFQAFADHGLCQQSCSGGAVAGHIVGLGGNFLYQLSTHVLKGILQFDLLCDGHAVVGDQRCAILLVQNNIAALRTERDFYGISKRVDAVFQGLAGFIAPNNHFRHRDISLRLCYYSMIARISPALTMVYSSSPTLISVPAYLPTRT